MQGHAQTRDGVGSGYCVQETAEDRVAVGSFVYVSTQRLEFGG